MVISLVTLYPIIRLWFLHNTYQHQEISPLFTWLFVYHLTPREWAPRGQGPFLSCSMPYPWIQPLEQFLALKNDLLMVNGWMGAEGSKELIDLATRSIWKQQNQNLLFIQWTYNRQADTRKSHLMQGTIGPWIRLGPGCYLTPIRHTSGLIKFPMALLATGLVLT